MIIVFFSFKGGVGRSSTLINVARFLAKAGKNVTIADFDIAAPGIDIFEGTNLRTTPREFAVNHGGSTREDIERKRREEKAKATQKGVTEYLNEVFGNPQAPEPIDVKEYLYIYKSLGEIKHSTDKDKVDEIRRYRETSEGMMHIMRAGCHEKEGYAGEQRELDAKISMIDDVMNLRMQLNADRGKFTSNSKELLKKIARSQNSTKDFLDAFSRWTESLMSEEDLNFPPSRDAEMVVAEVKHGEDYERLCKGVKTGLEKNSSYVLIDARPGLSSISIFAMQKLADVVVLCFNLNPYNFEAIRDVYENLVDICGWKKFALNPYRRIVLVVTPVPRYARQFKVFEERIRQIGTMQEAVNPGPPKELDPIIVPFNEQMTLRDALIADEKESEPDPTARAYIRLAELLVSMNQNDVENKIRKAEQGRGVREIMAAFEQLLDNQNTNALSERDLVQTRHAYGKFLLQMGRYNLARNQLRLAQKDSDKIRASGGLPDEERVLYAGHEELCFDAGLACYNYHRDPLRKGDEPKPEGLLDEARKFFQMVRGENEKNEVSDSREQSPHSGAEQRVVRSLLLEGDILIDMAEQNSTNKVEQLQEAKERFARAVEIAKDEAEHHFRLGLVSTYLSTVLGYRAIDSARERAEANRAFEHAVKLRENFPDAWFEWGKNLYYQSAALPEQRQELLREADAKFRKAVDYRSDFADVYYYWGLTQSKLSAPVVDHIEKYEGTMDRSQVEHLVAMQVAARSKDLDPEARAEGLKQAGLHFSSAVTYRMEFKEAYFFWGAVLLIRERSIRNTVRSGADNKVASLSADRVFRDAFYKLEPAIAQFFDYPQFYFNPEEIDEIKKDPYGTILTLERLFAKEPGRGDESEAISDTPEEPLFEKIGKLAGLPGDFKDKFERQFEGWLNKEELAETRYSPFLERLILYAAFRRFMTDEERSRFTPFHPKLEHAGVQELLAVIAEVAARDAWKNRKLNAE